MSVETDFLASRIDFPALAERERLCAEYFSRIAIAAGEQRKIAVCTLASEIFDSWARRRVCLVKSPDDYWLFRSEQGTYLSLIVLPCLESIQPTEEELQAIDVAVKGRLRYWSAEAIERANLHSSSPTNLDGAVPVGVHVGAGARVQVGDGSTDFDGATNLKSSSEVSSGSLRPHQWEDIEIVFISDERVKILAGGRHETKNFEELGFSDGRSETPNRSWGILRTLAKARGTMPRLQGDSKRAAVEKEISRLKTRLKQHFGIQEDPMPLINGVGFQTRFKIRCAPAFDS